MGEINDISKPEPRPISIGGFLEQILTEKDLIFPAHFKSETVGVKCETCMVDAEGKSWCPIANAYEVLREMITLAGLSLEPVERKKEGLYEPSDEEYGSFKVSFNSRDYLVVIKKKGMMVKESEFIVFDETKMGNYELRKDPVVVKQNKMPTFL